MDFSPSFTDRDDLIKKVAHHFIYLQQFEELQDFLKGTQMMPDSCSLHKSYAQLVWRMLEFNTNSKKAQLEKDIIFNLKTFIDEIHEKKAVRASTLIDLEDDNVEASDMKG